MSNKIEISRDLAERCLSILALSPSGLYSELRALLAAPVVERQPVAWEIVSSDEPWRNKVVRRADVADEYACKWRAEGAKAEVFELYREQHAPVSVVLRKLEMAHVVEAHMEIAGCPILTSNQCHALAMKLNAYLNKEPRQ